MSLNQETSNAPPESFTIPQKALWWLKKGAFSLGPEWEKAHMLCQQSEGTRTYDLVHALAHWIEGDENNTNYWYRRVGGGRAASIPEEWDRISKVLES